MTDRDALVLAAAAATIRGDLAERDRLLRRAIAGPPVVVISGVDPELACQAARFIAADVLIVDAPWRFQPWIHASKPDGDRRQDHE